MQVQNKTVLNTEEWQSEFTDAWYEDWKGRAIFF